MNRGQVLWLRGGRLRHTEYAYYYQLEDGYGTQSMPTTIKQSVPNFNFSVTLLEVHQSQILPASVFSLSISKLRACTTSKKCYDF